jgi:hypothetical protein
MGSLPPDPEGFVWISFEAMTRESEGVEVDQLVVGDGAVERSMVDGDGEFVADGLYD